MTSRLGSFRVGLSRYTDFVSIQYHIKLQSISGHFSKPGSSAFFKEFPLGGGGGRGEPNIFHKNREKIALQGLPEARRKAVLMTLN